MHRPRLLSVPGGLRGRPEARRPSPADRRRGTGRLPRLPVLVLLLAVAMAGCRDTDTGPTVDRTMTLSASLVSPNGPEGAVLIDVAADEVVSVEVVDQFTALVGRQAGDRAQVALVRTFPGEIRFRVVAVESPDPPEVQILQVADHENELRDDLSAYRVEMVR